MNRNRFFESMGSLGILLVVLILVNILSDRFYAKFDMTGDRLFTLSKGTENILGRIKGELHVRYYFSHSVESAPVYLKSYGKRIEELLQEYVYLSGGKIRLEVIDPKPDTEDEEWATKYGIQGTPLPSGETFYMGAVVMPGDKAIPLFNPNRESFLEYDITELISTAQNPSRKKVGILSSLDVVGSEFQFQLPGQSAPKKDWMFITQIKKNFDVINVSKDSVKIPDVDLLFVIHPKNFSEKTLYAIDQYVMNGGKLIVAVDPSSQKDEDPGYNRSSDLPKLFSKWGIGYSSVNLAADLNFATRVNSRRGVVEYPIWLNLDKSAMASSFSAVSELDSVMMIEAGSLSLSGSATGIQMTPLIQTTAQGNILQTFAIDRNDPFSLFSSLKKGTTPITLCAMYRGTFASAFSDKPESKEGESNYSGEHKSQVARESSILVIADTDVFTDEYSVRTLNFFGQQMATPLNDNLVFAQNILEFMAGDEDLISIRSRGKFSRPFTKVLEIQKDAQEKYKSKEEELSKRLQEVQEKLNTLQNHKVEGNKVILSKEQISELEKFREQERMIKKERREVRKNLREDIEALGQKLTFINVFFIPVLIGLIGIFRIGGRR